MYDLSLNNKFCVSTYHTNENSDDSKYMKENKIETILNFEEFVENGFKEMLDCGKIIYLL